MIVESLFQHAARQGQEIALIDDRGRYSYAELAAAAAGLGEYLKAQTRQPHVGLLLPAGAGFVTSFYGTLLAGKSVVPINYLLGEREIAHVIADSGIDTVVTAPPLLSRVKDLPLKVVDLSVLPKSPPAALNPKLPTPRGDDLAVLLYTSGTSGLPKGVMLTYANLQSNADACIEWAALQSRHHFLGIIPLFHSFGMTAMMIAPLQLGALIVYMARFNPAATVAAIKQHKVSLVFGVPSMYAAIAHVKDAGKEDFASIYALISGGEPLPATLRQVYEQRFGQPLYEGYGLSETSPVVTLNTPQFNRPGSVGKAIPGAQLRIVDEEGRSLPAGQIGEIQIKGPMVMKGYWKLPEETAAVLGADGFFRTGDLGKLDDDGFLYITGRKKEMIIVSGEKAYPREIEETILLHPAVREVAVVGKRDAGRGEIIAAFVIVREGQELRPEMLRQFCREQGLPPWKCPREVTIVPDLPRTPTGKVLKRKLVEA